MFKMLLFNLQFRCLTLVQYISKGVNWEEETPNVTEISQEVHLALFCVLLLNCA